MKTCRCLIVMLAAVTMASAAAAQVPYGSRGSANSIGVPKSSVVAIDQQLSRMQSLLRQYEIKLSEVKQQLQDTKARVNSGLATPSEVTALETQTAGIVEGISQHGRELTAIERLKALASPVDVTLKSSTIRQAAEALARASKLSITVDPKVPQDVKVNAEAQNVPLGAVIEVIANGAGLIIVPTEDGGLLLRLPGKLVVEGKDYMTEGDSAPWSDDWGILSIRAGYFVGRKYLALFDFDLDGFTPTPGYSPPPALVKPAPKGPPGKVSPSNGK